MRRRSIFFTGLVTSCLWASSFVWAKAAPPLTADAIYQATGVQGGLVVHVGCGDGRLTVSLRRNERYVVQGLDTDPDRLEQARRTVDAAGLTGPVSVRLFDGQHLPYVDSLVNLLVVSERFRVTQDELLRVLAPGGVAYVRQADGWKKWVKPWPEDMDQWTHFLHDAGGNEVSEDRQVGPPKGLRWTAGPRHCRSHEWPTSVQAVVTAGGRLFSILDEAPAGVYRHLPQKCRLVARDAFSGVLLWKVPLRNWQPDFGTGTGGRWQMHHTIPRRLVADEQHVYVTLQFADSPVSVLDAATGRVLVEALPGTRGADELLLSDGVLVVKCTKGRSVGATERLGRDSFHEPDRLVAVDVRTGRLLWQKDRLRVVPYALAADAGRVVYHDLDALVCVDLRTGKEHWRTACPLKWTFGGGVSLVVHDGVVLFHARGQLERPSGSAEKSSAPASSAAVASKPDTKAAAAAQAKPSAKSKSTRAKAPSRRRRGGAGGRTMLAFSLKDGRLLWQRPGHESLAGASTLPADVFVIDGVVWYGRSTEGYDLHTGELRKTVEVWNLISPGHHYRCYRGKATCRYLIWPKRGAEFIDVEDENHMRHDWLRAPCFTSFVPANGLFYVPPSQCFCYPGVLVSGYLALSARPAASLEQAAGQLEVKPVAGSNQPSPQPAGPDDWPSYRHDIQRSGAASTRLAAKLRPSWQVQLATQAPQAVVVGQRLWVVEKDAHRIQCLDARSGQPLWSFTAGGRIDSPPTYWQGRLLFGCRDGRVYCLSAADGRLLWRFRAAPDPRQVVSFEQLESVWPVSGSVLVLDGVVYFAAGRSSFLDGGILVYGLDAKTGRVVAKNTLVGPWPDIKKDQGTPFAMEGALPDLLVSDGQNLFMGRVKFDLKLNRVPLQPASSLGELDMGSVHLVATGGFLDDTGFDRIYWMYSRWWPGFYLAQHAPKSGQLVVFDRSTTYAVKYFYRRVIWSPAFFPGEKGYLLYADDNANEPTLLARRDKSEGLKWLPDEAYSDQHRRGGRDVEKGTGWVRLKPPKWQKLIPTRVRALLLAGDLLFAAGVPDRVPPDDPLAAFEGRLGGVLQVFSTQDGRLLASYQLESAPAFDGLSAAHGRLYLTTLDAKLLCFEPAP